MVKKIEKKNRSGSASPMVFGGGSATPNEQNGVGRNDLQEL
jgi:hypothetical protein